MNPKGITVIAVCPHCNESVGITMSKPEIKVLWKSLKMGRVEAQLFRERELERLKARLKPT